MALYEIELTDGRKFQVEADKPPTEQEVMEKLGVGEKKPEFKPNTVTADPKDFTPKPDESQLINPPTTWGFVKNLGSELAGQAKEVGSALKNYKGGSFDNAPGVGGVANFIANRAKADTNLNTIYKKPASFLEDVAAMTPVAEGAGKGIMRSGERIGNVAAGAAKGAVGGESGRGVVKGMLKGGIEGLTKKVNPRIPGFDPYMPNVGAGGDGGPVSGDRTPYIGTSPDMAQPNPNAGGQLRPGVRASTLEEELIAGLKQEMGDKVNKMNAAPGQETVGAGPTRQSGTFPKGEVVGQPGGYTSGRPSQTRTQWDIGNTNYSGASDEPGGWRGGGNGPANDANITDRMPPEFQPDMVDDGGAAADAADREWQAAHPAMPKTVANPPTPDRYLQETDWHSGAESGSPEASQAAFLHRHEAELDAIYKQLLADPRK